MRSAERGIKSAILNQQSAIVISGPDAENERSDMSDRKGASDDSRVAMQSPLRRVPWVLLLRIVTNSNKGTLLGG
jgi:hypothetical protein